MTDTDNQSRTFVIDVWEDESIWTWEGVAASADEAEAAATAELNSDWKRNYESFAEIGAGTYTATNEYPAVMAPRLTLATVDAYQNLVIAARAMLNAFGGDTPDWLRDEAVALEDAIDAIGGEG